MFSVKEYDIILCKYEAVFLKTTCQMVGQSAGREFKNCFSKVFENEGNRWPMKHLKMQEIETVAEEVLRATGRRPGGAMTA